MNKALLYVSLSLSVLCLAFLIATHVNQPDANVGRYQLVSGKFTVTSVRKDDVVGRHGERDGMFRLDTMTGEVSKLVEETDKDSGSYTFRWDHGKSFAETWNQAMLETEE